MVALGITARRGHKVFGALRCLAYQLKAQAAQQNLEDTKYLNIKFLYENSNGWVREMSNPKKTPELLSTPAEGSMEAPVVYFESSPTFAVSAGVGQIVLEMLISEPGEQGIVPRSRRRVVAHLRGPLVAFDSLRRAINDMEAMITPKTGEKSH